MMNHDNEAEHYTKQALLELRNWGLIFSDTYMNLTKLGIDPDTITTITATEETT